MARRRRKRRASRSHGPLKTSKLASNRARRPADEMPPKAKPKPKPKQTPKAPYPGFKPEDKKKQNGPGHNEVKKAVVNGEAPGDRW